MKRDYETIVLGLGGIGSAALYWLARRIGGEVLGLEQFSLGHHLGASQDHSRIIRLAYDNPAYTALTPHTFIHWREVEAESGVQLVHRTGSLVFGPGDRPEAEIDLYTAAMSSAGIPFERLSPEEAMRHFPQFRLQEGDQVLYSANDGFVDPGKANAVHINLGARPRRSRPGSHPGPAPAPAGGWRGAGDRPGDFQRPAAGDCRQRLDQPRSGGRGPSAAAHRDRGAGDLLLHPAPAPVRPGALPGVDLARRGSASTASRPTARQPPRPGRMWAATP